jgi:hypothetical protein
MSIRTEACDASGKICLEYDDGHWNRYGSRQDVPEHSEWSFWRHCVLLRGDANAFNLQELKTDMSRE